MDKEKKKCPKGYRRNKAGDCIEMTAELLKHKQSLRNKKKGVVYDEEGKIIRPPKWGTQKKRTDEIIKEEVEEPEEVEEDSLNEESADVIEEKIENSIDNLESIIESSIPEVEPIQLLPTSLEKDISPSSSIEEEISQSSSEKDLYPSLNDPEFSAKIYQRREFADTKYDGEIKDIKKQANELCNAPFELMPHQLFVRNFLSFQTPYNSLLLYHGLGSGKTCSAIGIAEEMRGYMKQMGITKRIIIVASPNVQDNFRLQLFDERRLEQLPDGTWNLNTCIGNSLLNEINPTNLVGLTRDKIISQIKSLIQNYYVFMGNKGEFANYIRKAITVPADAGYSPEEAATLRNRKIKAHFNNRLVILDEIHNIRISDANKTKMTLMLLNEIAKKSDNMRMLLLSATPMYNSYQEIIWLVNLLNANDKRPAVRIEDVFQSSGDSFWKIGPDGTSGKDVLIRKITGYISYVRGENPYVFPFRIYPEIFDPKNAFPLKENYPKKQMNQMPIEDPLQFIPVYKNKIGEYQERGYQAIIDYLGLKSTTVVDKNGKERIMPTFENMENFGYTLLMAPLEALIITYPNMVLDKKKKELSEKDNKDMIKNMVGKGGLMNIVKYKEVKGPIPRRYDYEYIPKMKAVYQEIFNPENIGRFSSKIETICKLINKPSKGIILIYSQFIDGGLVPMALALESMGFSRYASTPEHNHNLFKNKQKKKDDPKYVMITGEKSLSQNNNEDLKYVTNKENKDGSRVKVILISMAASEGLDFKNIRQIHILEPWYNMNRIEQIVGRGVRNLSHCDLEFEDRNVEIYLHGTELINPEEEAADMYVYRSAEKKAIQIGYVTRVLKENAVDCLLNIGQTNFTEKELLTELSNQSIRIRLSSRGEELLPFQVGDKPRTEVCDYMEDCAFQCKAKPIRGVIKNTYDENFVKNNSVVIMKKIRDLFMERVVYRRDHLKNAINFIKKYPDEHIYYALTRFVNNKSEVLIDKYGRSGHLISRGEYYAFQPNEITDERISVFERTTPVDYKPVSLRLEIPKEFHSQEQVGEAGEIEEKKETKKIASTYEKIMGELRIVIQKLVKKKLQTKATDSDWYNHANQIVPELLTTHHIKSELINTYVAFHYLDRLSIEDRLILIGRLFPRKGSLNAYEIIVQLYFSKLLLETEDETGDIIQSVILADGGINRLFVLRDGVWSPAEYTDEQLFLDIKKRKLTVPLSKINKTEIGFISPFKGKDLVFKTKDMTQKRNNKGAKCTDSSKVAIANKIGGIMGEPTLYQSTEIERPELCVMLEILMRWKTESTQTTYFFGPEQTNEMDLANLRF